MSTSAISGLYPFLSRNRAAKPAPKQEPEWRRLIRKAYQLWDAYQAEPTPAREERLRFHLELMGVSVSKKVAAARKDVAQDFAAKKKAS